ncbi:hypothetical protein BDV93DRAFT_612189 [Ceratobasidium sp. AG-I]|nr:hypothetical protein BDV93DRAFT_612189 [Ceratobasidium sp. AG-I]
MGAFAEAQWSRPPKIILGLDIGTTQSAVTFAHLYPGSIQYLHRVSAWPGQESHKGESKIPTLVYYDTAGKAVSFGAEALTPVIVEKSEDEGWQLARHFKLHLHPDAMKQKHNLTVQPLPGNVDLLTIYTDFMVYLMKHTQQFFESRIIDGRKVWEELSGSMSIIIAHPNGWTVKEENFLRKAAVAAKYTAYANAHSQIQFVSEAEASVHFCMFHSDLSNKLKPNVNFIVCDAGGFTVDTTAYCVKTMSPILELDEKKASACIQAGGIFVNLEWEKHLGRVLKTLGLPEEDQTDMLNYGIKDFENVTKKAFHEIDLQYRVDLGFGRLSRPEVGIKRGAITLDGATIRSFFDNCVEEIIASVRQQMEGFNPNCILLVGGFNDSSYLRNVLKTEFNSSDCLVNIANDSTSKAVADGAVIWCAKLSVTNRTTHMPYGIETNDPDHTGSIAHRNDADYAYADNSKHLTMQAWPALSQKRIEKQELEEYIGRLKEQLLYYTDDLYQQEIISMGTRLRLQEPCQISQKFEEMTKQVENISRILGVSLAQSYKSDLPRTVDLVHVIRQCMSCPEVPATGDAVDMEPEDFLDFGCRALINESLMRMFDPKVFHPALDPEQNLILVNMYNRIREKEPQLIAGRWRISSFNSYETNSYSPTEQAGKLCQGALFRFCTVLCPRDVCIEAINMITPDVEYLFKHAWSWNVLMKTSVAMLDFHPYHVMPGEAYDPENVNLEGGRRSKPPTSGSILVTTRLGLMASEASGKSTAPQYSDRIKAKVLAVEYFV